MIRSTKGTSTDQAHPNRGRRRGSRPLQVALGAALAFGLTTVDGLPPSAAPSSESLLQWADLAFDSSTLDLLDSQIAGPSTYPRGSGHRFPLREDQSNDPVAPNGASKPRSMVGIASTYGPGWDGWLAWPGGPGWKLRVCGPAKCVVIVTTDAGPDRAMQRAGRVVDLDVPTFERVAGAPWTIGLTRVTVTVLGRIGARSS